MMPLIYRHSPNANSNPWNTSHMAFVRLARSHAFDKPLTISRPEVSHTHTHTYTSNKPMQKRIGEEKHIFRYKHIYNHTHKHTHTYTFNTRIEL